jgi:predicted HTH domain antitoxin
MAMHDIIISYPAELLASMSEAQLQQLAREAFYVHLYEQGLISSGRAGAQLGMTRSDFLDLLGKYGVSYFDPQTDLAADVRNADAAHT